ncbi:MAG TPA: dephospho-CoA kinase [Solirubrobacteraceae bacterium]|jgi:dephospho-CoA kinase|nr:dephospho-CoA kinase [Solirubrobacteraceae bacterium]
MSDPVPVIGLTGGMGAGKSTALAALERLGAAVLSSDAIVHELLLQPDVRTRIVERFGPQVAPEGTLDRAALARGAFGNDADRTWLEALLWPLVGARADAWIREVRARQPPPRAAVIEVPLLFESGEIDGYDATIAVVAEEALRTQRASSRGHALGDERVARQLPQEEKARLATFVVRNDGSESDLERELSEVLGKLAR